MTPVERRAALVERMARAMLNAETWSSFWGYGEAKVLADAALDLALEEAAQVAEEHENDAGYGVDGTIIAASIRALKG